LKEVLGIGVLTGIPPRRTPELIGQRRHIGRETGSHLIRRSDEVLLRRPLALLTGHVTVLS
jgi:hypothetical protein